MTTSQTMDQMAMQVNLAIKILKDGTLPTTQSTIISDVNESGGDNNAESS